MNAVDSSVAIAAAAAWQEDHQAARRWIKANPRIVAHAALETYSVLTRLPRPYRRSAASTADYLRLNFPDPWILPDGDLFTTLVPRLATAGIVGGSVYDALVGLTAKAAGATLITRDRRAEHTYDALAVPYRRLTG